MAEFPRTTVPATAPRVLFWQKGWGGTGGAKQEGKHEAKECVGVHFEPGPDGGVVTLDDTTILDVAMRILGDQNK